jgi:hypothetical protein
MKSKWDLGALETDNEQSDAGPLSSRAARLGIVLSFVAICIALVLLLIQLISEPSFEKCSALENQSERNACYDGLREKLFRNPAKGADVPNLRSSND